MNTESATEIDIVTGATHQAWLQRRRGGIGASETPIVLGLKGSRVELYLRKRGELTDRTTTEAMAWGLRLEDDIVDAYQERTGRRVVETQRFAVHPAMPWLLATIDGVTECGRLVEFKAVGHWGNARQLGESGDASTLPDEWVVQVVQGLQIGLACGFLQDDEADVAVFGPGLQLRVYPVRYSDELAAIGAEADRAFWHDHVVRGVMPSELRPADADTFARVFQGDSGETVELDQDVADAARAYQELGDRIRELEDERAIARAHMLREMGDAARGLLPGGWEIRRRVIETRGYTVEPRTQVRLTVKAPGD